MRSADRWRMGRPCLSPITPAAWRAGAREGSRAIESRHTDGARLLFQLANAGEEVTTVCLPPAAAKLLMQMLAEMGKGRRERG